MQFTTSLLSLALVAAGVTATPNAILESRQIDNFFFIQYFSEPNCQGTLVTSSGFLDNGSDECRLPSPTVSNPSWRVRQNGIKRPVNVYTNADCTTGNGGNVVTVNPDQFGCFTQHVGSVKFGSV